jgi:hypothetical protein
MQNGGIILKYRTMIGSLWASAHKDPEHRRNKDKGAVSNAET